ncbi:MAG: TadE/TadG family type IV pilus assembly protein, partial [Pirellulales bacterium]
MKNSRGIRIRTRGQQRRGATLIESAVVMFTLLLTLFGTLDLGRAVFSYVTVSEAARRVARAAIVHGEMADGQLGQWGPDLYEGTATDGTPIANTLVPLFAALNEDEVQVRVEWPDNTNRPSDRVRVTVTQPYVSIVPLFLG